MAVELANADRRLHRDAATHRCEAALFRSGAEVVDLSKGAEGLLGRTGDAVAPCPACGAAAAAS